MNVLDENIRDDQRVHLRQWGIRFRQIGKEISRPGIQDDNVLPLLHHLKRPTLFSQDEDFFKREFCHEAYCLVWLDVKHVEAAFYIRRFLRQPNFRAKALRMGKVARAHAGGVAYWEAGKERRASIKWRK
jgi:hypothetical protein